jgi:4-hydroxybenzoate polyprenyltransferase
MSLDSQADTDGLTAREGARDRLVYLFRLSRPRFWFYLAGPVLVGLVYAASSPEELLSPISYALFLYFLVPANLFLYGVNDYFDAEIDEKNPKKEGKEVRYTEDTFVAVAVVVSGALGFVFVPFLSFDALVWFGVFYALAVGYSATPTRFKTVPFADSVSNGLYIVPGVVAYLSLGPAETLPPLAVAGAWLWAMGMHTFSAVPDIEPDREGGVETTATFLGERATLGYCAAVWGASVVVFAPLSLPFAALLLVYPALALGVAYTDTDVSRAYWYFPLLNTAVGAVVTFVGLWRLVQL